MHNLVHIKNKNFIETYLYITLHTIITATSILMLPDDKLRYKNLGVGIGITTEPTKRK